MGQVWQGTSPRWAGAPSLGLVLCLGLETLGVGGAPLGLGGSHPPSPWPPPHVDGFQGWRPPSRGPINSGGEGGQQHHSPWRLPLPLQHLSLSQKLGEALPRPRYFHHHAVMLLLEPSSSTSPSPLLDQEGGDVTLTVRVLNAEVPSVRR